MPKELSRKPRVSGRHNDLVRVSFRLTPDQDGYPPAAWEHLWAREVADDLYEVDNTPFFVRGVSYKDVVSTRLEEGKRIFVRVVRPSDHSTLRVICFRQESVGVLRAQLHELGCETELSHLPKLFAVDAGPQVDLGRVRQLLSQGEVREEWEFEEGVIRAH